MKTLQQIREASGGKEAYQKFFNSILKKFGVSSPAELEGDKKKEFYDAIDAGWEGDNEKPEANEKMNQDNMDPETMNDADPDEKEINASYGKMNASYKKESVNEKSKLKAGKGKITVDLNWDGSAADKKFAETKYKIKLKITRTGALATGEKARVLAYVSGQDYAMDDEDIEDLMPEILEMFSTRSLGLKGASKRSRDKARGSDLSSAELKKAEKIAKKHSGDMKKAMAEIEKIKKGSSESDAVMTMLKKHNEDTTEDMYMHTSKKKRKLKAHKGDHMDEAVSVDRRTMGFKEAMKRRAEAKAKREAKKIKDAKSQAKSDMASIDANYAYDGDVAEILASANKSIMGQHEDAAANASSSGAVDMNTNGKSVKKKKDKENLMAKYGY